MLSLLIFKRYLFSFRSEALVRRITWLSVLGVAIGVGSLILVQSVMKKFNSNIEERLLASEPHLVAFLSKDQLAEDASALEAISARVQKIKNVRVYGFEIQDVVVRTADGHFSGAVARGVDRASLAKIVNSVQSIQHESRRFEWHQPSVEDQEVLEDGEVLLGSSLAVTLGVFEGDRLVVIPPESLLLPPDEAPTYDTVQVGRKIDLNSADLNSRGLYYIRGEAMSRLSQSVGKRVGLEVWAGTEQALEESTAVLSKAGLTIETWQERNAALFFALKLERVLMGIFLSLSALIAGFSIVSVMALLISQKSKELGILMAMGMSAEEVHKLFVQVGVMLSAVGVFTGVLWGAGVSLYLQNYPLKLLPDIYYDSRISAEVSLISVVVIVVLAMVLALIGAHFPVRELKKLTPVQVLKSGHLAP